MKRYELAVVLVALGACTVEGADDPALIEANALPAWVDHEYVLPPVRDQGSRGTCTWFAWTAAVEAFHGLQTWLSVEQMGVRLGLGIDVALNWRVLNMALAPEQYWPYGGRGQPGLDAHSIYTIDQTRTLTGDEQELMEVLAAGDNVVLGYAHDIEWETADGVLVNPQINWFDADWRKFNCNFRMQLDNSCGRHMVLIVGYEQRLDSDGVNRTFFKFRNSWGPGWGDDGYGFMSHAYLKYLGTSATMIAMGSNLSIFAGAPEFCPRDIVKRKDMARYLLRVLHRDEPGWFPPDPDPAAPTFADYGKNESEAPWVYELARVGITKGCSEDGSRFCPDDAVPREQMAAFLIRTKYFEYIGREDQIPIDDPADLTRFVDVTGPEALPGREIFARYIARLYEDGITRGVDASHFDPLGLVPREQMATFLMRMVHPDQIGNPPPKTDRFVDVWNPDAERDFEGFIEEAVDENVMEACNWMAE